MAVPINKMDSFCVICGKCGDRTCPATSHELRFFCAASGGDGKANLNSCCNDCDKTAEQSGDYIPSPIAASLFLMTLWLISHTDRP